MFFGERLVFELPPWSKYVRPEGVSGCKYSTLGIAEYSVHEEIVHIFIIL